MSDVTIPGVTSKYDTQTLIEGLMKVERIPRDRAAERLEEVKLQKTVWLEFSRKLSSLRESARVLFSFQTPFNERVATSANPSVLEATATREAVEATHSIEVLQAAAADRFMSDQLGKDYTVPAGTYVFGVGDGSVKLSFSGGTLDDFVAALNKKNPELVRAQVVNVSPDARVLVIESMKTGKDNRLTFTDAAESLGLSAGLIEPSRSSRQELALSPLSRFEQPLDAAKARTDGRVLTVSPGGEAASRLPSTLPSSGLVMEIVVELAERPDEGLSGPPPGPAIPGIGGIDYEGIHIDSLPSDAELPEWAPPVQPPRVDNGRVLYLIDGSGRSYALPALEAGGGYKTITVPLSAYSDTVAGLGVRNQNTHRDVRITSIRVYDPNEVSGFSPKNPVSTAQDAVIKMDGIQVTRPDNSIDDLIPGVTLDVKHPSKEPVDLTIEPDREAVKDSVIDLVGKYNRLMAEINILSRADQTILDELEYLTDNERETYSERLGLMQGDMTLSSIRSNLQRIMMDPYATRDGASLLSAMGISTNATSGGGYDASRLRGYLDIDEDKLDRALKDFFLRSKDTFGFDTDGDLLIDSGVALKLDTLTKGYVETGGIIALKTSTFDSQISSINSEIASLDKQLAAKEEEYRRKYGMMEGALEQMESSSSAWQNFMNQGD